MPDFHGEPTRVLENSFLQLEVLENSARIVRLSLKGKSNLFADLGSTTIDTALGSFRMRGGHRLWHAPESMPRTYIPDDIGGELTPIPGGVRMDLPAEPWTHIAKAIEVQLNPDGPQVTVRHELRNEGAWPVQFSAWGLTMFRLGGVAVLPQAIGNVDEAGLLPNRQLILWPYTRIDDPRLILRDDFILARPTPAMPLKFGYFNPHGWVAYWLDGMLFVKRFDVTAGASFPDHGCNSECYFNQRFIELESLSSLQTVPPMESLTHTELWEVYDRLDVPFIPADIQSLILRQD
jgi:hypothetical protein